MYPRYTYKCSIHQQQIGYRFNACIKSSVNRNRKHLFLKKKSGIDELNAKIQTKSCVELGFKRRPMIDQRAVVLLNKLYCKTNCFCLDGYTI